MFFQLHGKIFFYAFTLFISHCLHNIVRVDREGILMTISLWPTQPCIAVTPNIVDVPRTLPQQLSMLKMPGKEHEVCPLMRKMFLMVFRLLGNPLKCRGFLGGLWKPTN